jgi:hypothetical protein
MKQLLTLLFSLISLHGIAQIRKLEKNHIFSALYPGNNHFDNEYRLIRKVNRDGEESEFRTKYINAFYYKTGDQQKVIAILFSYHYNIEEHDVSSCHACHPEFEIAYFTYTNNSWVKQKFIENWKEATGSWGEGAEIEFKIYNKVNCLVLKSSYGNFGEFHEYIDYYNIEYLKKIKSIVK